MTVEFHEIVSIIFIAIWVAVGFMINYTNKQSKDSEKTLINGKEAKVKTLKFPLITKSDDSLSSEFNGEFNGKSSKEDSNPFEV